ncbi:MAG: hypothetical protein J5J06_15555 [Phycisphaerae bacterium]|nr:hypothetical protein [Phycisphaerae bacterium]
MRETKIVLGHRSIRKIDDVTDMVALLAPGNRNQQHAMARILLALRASDGPCSRLTDLGPRFEISRRTLERARAKLSCLGLIEHVSWMDRRFGGRSGWRLSCRMSQALRRLADWIDTWKRNDSAQQIQKESALAELLRP